MWHAERVLKLGGARLLDDRDTAAVSAALDEAPVTGCMLAARVELAGLEPRRLGGELWGIERGRRRGNRLEGLCFAGPNMIPLFGDGPGWRAFADRALRRRRTCSSLVGPSEQVLGLWEELAGEWEAREIRARQPLLATAGPPSVAPAPAVRRVCPGELERYLPAAVAMFVEEVGVDPGAQDGGAGYRARVAELIAAGRAFAMFEGTEVVFKAEIGALSAAVGQIQGVWVHPDRRGEGLGASGTAAVVDTLVNRLGRTASLYVNGYNLPALATYRRVGFREVGEYATVLF